MTDTATYRQALLDRLSELDTRLHDIESELDTPRSADWEDQATEREGEEVLERLGESGQAEIARIRAALARIRDGSYGICVQCGEPISEARLSVLPATPLCKECAT
jgi:RNA polymerase-binding transcription factor DksA